MVVSFLRTLTCGRVSYLLVRLSLSETPSVMGAVTLMPNQPYGLARDLCNPRLLHGRGYHSRGRRSIEWRERERPELLTHVLTTR